jgi:hypothetical protein
VICDGYLLTVIEICLFWVFDLAEHLRKETKLSSSVLLSWSFTLSKIEVGKWGGIT